ncbi:MAG TPA: DUF1566 domain-containing protein [Myxococcota bacterium]|nr:DUF1566 domain-containing protein [Myxococcota bacterium]
MRIEWITALIPLVVAGCQDPRLPPWMTDLDHPDVHGEVVVSDSFIDSEEDAGGERDNGHDGDVSDEVAPPDDTAGDLPDDLAVVDSEEDTASDVPDVVVIPDPVCAAPVGECLVSFWDPVKMECVTDSAPDGTPCEDGYCSGGSCSSDCWKGSCPAGLGPASSCRCVVPSSGSRLCLSEGGFVDCEELRPGYPWSGQDAQLVSGARSFVDNGDGTVTDQVTGLEWERDAFTPLSMELAIEHCFYHFDLPGDGWRLPTIRELFSLIDFGQTTCMWDPVFGDSCSGDRMFWSSTQAYMTANVCTLHPRGNIEACELDGLNRVRCVRGDLPPPDPVPDRYLAFEQVVLDRATGLGWQNVSSFQPMEWAEGLRACQRLGTGWRLPTSDELVSIIDMTMHIGKAYSETGDPCAKWDDALGRFCSQQLYFWTSTPNPRLTDPVSAYAVHFFSGHVHENPVQGSRSQKFNVRCVKDFR